MAESTIAAFGRQLAELRAHGVAFADAWHRAFPPSAPCRTRAREREALKATIDAWRRAYVGEPAEACEIGGALLADLLLEDDEERATGLSAATKLG